MLKLLDKAKFVFLALFVLYLASFFAGYVSGKLGFFEYKGLMERGVFRLSGTLEYKIPGYGNALRLYKDFHDQRKKALVSEKNFLALGLLIFLNNFVVANLTMMVRALFVFPLLLNVCGKFLQGVIFAQTGGHPLIVLLFVMEFGGYFLISCAVLTGVLWTIFIRRFGFPTRREAIWSGLKLLGCMYLVSGIAIFLGSAAEGLFLWFMLA